MSGSVSMEGNENKYYRMHRTVSKMLHDRGYLVDEEIDQEMDFDTFKLTYPNVASLNSIYGHSDPMMPRILTKFDCPPGRFATAELKALVEEAASEKVDRMIFIVREGSITANTKKAIERLRLTKKLQVELFEEKEVIINITEHELVPKHVPLTADQKAELLDRYKVNETQLPRIMRTDPVVKYLGVDPGTILQITRKSETAGRYVTYRLVIG
jgi:DNA-directed RNA polymerase I, II, and III subunit RPABC1